MKARIPWRLLGLAVAALLVFSAAEGARKPARQPARKAAVTPAPKAAKAGAADDVWRFRAVTGGMRLAGAGSAGALWAGFTPVTRAAAPILEPTKPGDAELLTDFYAHSAESVLVRGDKAYSGWRDPVADVWIIAEWQRVGTNWQMDRATMALTQDLTSAPAARATKRLSKNGGKVAAKIAETAPTSTLRPAYPGLARDGIAKAVVVAHHQGVTAFWRAVGGDVEMLPWGRDPRAARAREVALMRLDAARLSRVAARSAVGDAGQAINAALVEETPSVPEVSNGVASRLARLAVTTRLSLQPIQYVPGKGEVTALVQSSFEPQKIFVTHLQPARVDGTVRVANVEAIDLARAE